MMKFTNSQLMLNYANKSGFLQICLDLLLIFLGDFSLGSLLMILLQLLVHFVNHITDVLLLYITEVILFRVLFILVNLQVTLSIIDNLLREFQHSGHLNSITLLHFSSIYTILKLQVVLAIHLTRRVHVYHSLHFLLDLYHLVEVSCEQTVRIYLLCQVLAQRP